MYYLKSIALTPLPLNKKRKKEKKAEAANVALGPSVTALEQCSLQFQEARCSTIHTHDTSANTSGKSIKILKRSMITLSHLKRICLGLSVMNLEEPAYFTGAK